MLLSCLVRRYICCNGTCPCSGRCGEQNAPEFCLAMEVCCCFAQSVAATRWGIQDELRLQTTQCDNCIIGTSEWSSRNAPGTAARVGAAGLDGSSVRAQASAIARFLKTACCLSSCVCAAVIFAQYFACLCSIAACLTGEPSQLVCRAPSQGTAVCHAPCPGFVDTAAGGLAHSTSACTPTADGSVAATWLHVAAVATPAGSDEINQLAQLLDCIADILWCSVCACMQTQHKQVGHTPQRKNRHNAGCPRCCGSCPVCVCVRACVWLHAAGAGQQGQARRRRCRHGTPPGARGADDPDRCAHASGPRLEAGVCMSACREECRAC